MPSLSRRDFLRIASRGLLAASGLLGLGAIIRFLGFEPQPPPPKQYDVGLLTDFLPNSRTVVTSVPALIIREHGRVRAIDLACTHLGCTVEAKPDGFVCPCHGSCYNSDGEVTEGPAQTALSALKVEQTSDGRLIVYKN